MMGPPIALEVGIELLDTRASLPRLPRPRHTHTYRLYDRTLPTVRESTRTHRRSSNVSLRRQKGWRWVHARERREQTRRACECVGCTTAHTMQP